MPTTRVSRGMSLTREIHPMQFRDSVGAALLVWGLLLAFASSPARAAEIAVNSLADDADVLDGECTLREAITSANTDPTSVPAAGECANGSGDDVINFALPGTAPWTVNLTGALPNLTSNIEIEGPGADQFTVRGVLKYSLGRIPSMRKAYQTDLSDAEWGTLEPHLPTPEATGRPRLHGLREIL